MQKPCEQCGTLNPSKANYCRTCGVNFSDACYCSAIMATPLMQQWRSLVHDLTRKEVRKILGEPLRIQFNKAHAIADQEIWSYEYQAADSKGNAVHGQLTFTTPEGRLNSWTEPDWKSYQRGS